MEEENPTNKNATVKSKSGEKKKEVRLVYMEFNGIDVSKRAQEIKSVVVNNPPLLCFKGEILKI